MTVQSTAFVFGTDLLGEGCDVVLDNLTVQQADTDDRHANLVPYPVKSVCQKAEGEHLADSESKNLRRRLAHDDLVRPVGIGHATIGHGEAILTEELRAQAADEGH